VKHIILIALLLVFAFVAFIPPDGVSKFPVAKIQFSVDFEELDGPPGK